MRRARTPPPDPARPVPASASGVAEAGGGAPAVLLAPGVIAVGRARFAVGLLWQLRDEVRTLAEQVRQTGTGGDDLTLYTPHSGRRQIGLATPRRGARRGMRAGAANLDVASAGQAWLAVFRLESRLPGSVSAWWIVAERGALIYEDRILFDEGEARSAFAEAAEAPGWQRILCPPAWGIPGADASDIALAMPLRPKGGALRPVSAVAAWAPRVAMAAILLILAAGGWFSYTLWQAEQTRLAEELARIERAARLARPPPAPPWVEAPDLASFVNGCDAALRGLHVVVPGWRSEAISCTAGAGSADAVAAWRPDGGRIAALIALLRARGLGDPQITADGGTLGGRIARKVEMAPRAGGAAEVPFAPEAIEARLRARFDTLSVAYALESRTPLGSARQAPVPGAQNVPGYHELTFQTSVALGEFVRLVSDVPALVGESLVWDPVTFNWTLVARIYHPLPPG
ncbi:MAG: hypothetical protein RLZ26_2008 [Pseudomonadota bacterium]|jgi:hypothetical protein